MEGAPMGITQKKDKKTCYAIAQSNFCVQFDVAIGCDVGILKNFDQVYHIFFLFVCPELDS